MNCTPWPNVLQGVDSLNDPQAPFRFAAEGDALVGYWDVAQIRMLGLTGASSYDETYRIEFRPVSDGVFDWTEHRTTTRGSVGPGQASGSASKFKGKSVSISFGTTAGLSGSSKGEPTNVASYSFDTRAIKEPAMQYLERHGWTKKRGLFNRLFG